MKKILKAVKKLIELREKKLEVESELKSKNHKQDVLKITLTPDTGALLVNSPKALELANLKTEMKLLKYEVDKLNCNEKLSNEEALMLNELNQAYDIITEKIYKLKESIKNENK